MFFRRRPPAPPRPVWLDAVEAAPLEEYQKGQLKTTIEVVERLFPDRAARERVRVLDIGCNPTQDRILSRQVAHVTGTNLGGMEKETGDERTSFVNSGEHSLPCDDDTFDFVFSLNIMEHLSDTRGMVAEHVRAVKPGGYGYMEWCASWGCYAGHHIFSDMVRYWEKVHGLPRTKFEDGGEYVPDWGHLILSPEQMHAFVLKKLGPGTEKLVDTIVETIYRRTDQHGLSRLFLDEVADIVRSFDVEIVEFKRMEVPAPKALKIVLEAIHGEHDYDAHYAAIVFRKPLRSARPVEKPHATLVGAR